MKKNLRFALGMVLFTLALFVSCSNGSDTPQGVAIPTETPTTTPTTPPTTTPTTTTTTVYNELPAGTDGTAGESWTYVTFGRWPQTIKAESVEVDESVAEEHGMFTYCKGSDGEWYCKSEEKGAGSNSWYVYSNGKKVKQFVAGSTNISYKWFKVEPIKWRIVTTNYNGKKLLLAENVLTARIKYYVNYSGLKSEAANNYREINGETICPSNYKYSSIRAWLNGTYESEDTQDATYAGKGFLQTAFTNAEQSAIVTVVVDNGARSIAPDGDANAPASNSNRYACSDTNDKVFLLSVQEATKKDYGFAEYDEATAKEKRDRVRYRKATDFALAQGAFSNNDYVSPWVLRSPDGDTHVYTIRSGGFNKYATGDKLSPSGWVAVDTASYQGIVPALCVE